MDATAHPTAAIVRVRHRAVPLVTARKSFPALAWGASTASARRSKDRGKCAPDASIFSMHERGLVDLNLLDRWISRNKCKMRTNCVICVFLGGKGRSMKVMAGSSIRINDQGELLENLFRWLPIAVMPRFSMSFLSREMFHSVT